MSSRSNWSSTCLSWKASSSSSSESSPDPSASRALNRAMSLSMFFFSSFSRSQSFCCTSSFVRASALSTITAVTKLRTTRLPAMKNKRPAPMIMPFSSASGLTHASKVESPVTVWKRLHKVPSRPVPKYFIATMTACRTAGSQGPVPAWHATCCLSKSPKKSLSTLTIKSSTPNTNSTSNRMTMVQNKVRPEVTSPCRRIHISLSCRRAAFTALIRRKVRKTIKSRMNSRSIPMGCRNQVFNTPVTHTMKASANVAGFA
mmetsp:Transcript_8351/g.17767  ORF Transcript_8351/g.17767 Transcript_8351/m.17767 type:complete len:259 (-) Transcript_8351:172-948(-)